MDRAASLHWLKHDVPKVFDKACSLASNQSAPALIWNNVGYKHISPCTSFLSTHIEEKHFCLMDHIAEALRKEWQIKQQDTLIWMSKLPHVASARLNIHKNCQVACGLLRGLQLRRTLTWMLARACWKCLKRMSQTPHKNSDSSDYLTIFYWVACAIWTPSRDSSVGRALERRSEGPRLIPGLGMLCSRLSCLDINTKHVFCAS